MKGLVAAGTLGEEEAKGPQVLHGQAHPADRHAADHSHGCVGFSVDKENRAGFLQLYTWGMKRIMEKHLKAVDLVDEVVAKRKALLASRLPNLPKWPEFGDIPQDRVDDLSKELVPSPDNEPVTHWATFRQSGGDRKMRPPRRQNGCDWKGKLRRR